jgi:hypothetical protein
MCKAVQWGAPVAHRVERVAYKTQPLPQWRGFDSCSGPMPHVPRSLSLTFLSISLYHKAYK